VGLGVSSGVGDGSPLGDSSLDVVTSGTSMAVDSPTLSPAGEYSSAGFIARLDGLPPCGLDVSDRKRQSSDAVEEERKLLPP